MRVMVVGASGLIGTAVALRLAAHGHALRLVARRVDALANVVPHADCVRVDLAQMLRPEDWAPHLTGVDAVVNAAGLFREARPGDFDIVHVRAPCALFEAAWAAGVRRIVQISALGADAGAVSGFQRSKLRADEFLLGLPVAGCVLQPSLVYAAGGASTDAFLALAAAPLLALPAGGAQRVQPVHLTDVVDAVQACLAGAERRGRIAVVGAQCITLAEYLSTLRRALGFAPAWRFAVPGAWLRLAATLRLGGAWLDPEAQAMLARGNCADAAPLTQLLGRPPRAAQQFVDAHTAPLLRRDAQLRLLLPLLRCALAALWIGTGIVSWWIFPRAASLVLLARTGLHGALADASLVVAAVLDVVLGAALLVPRARRAAYLLQLIVMLGYSAIIAVALPEFLAHPYGPVLKNLPIAAATLLAWRLDRVERT